MRSAHFLAQNLLGQLMDCGSHLDPSIIEDVALLIIEPTLCAVQSVLYRSSLLIVVVATIEALRYVQDEIQPKAGRQKYNNIVLVCSNPCLIDLITTKVVYWRQNGFTYCNCAEWETFANSLRVPVATLKLNCAAHRYSGTAVSTDALGQAASSRPAASHQEINNDIQTIRSKQVARSECSSSPAKLSARSSPSQPPARSQAEREHNTRTFLSLLQQVPGVPPSLASTPIERLVELFKDLDPPAVPKKVKNYKLLKELDDLILALEASKICVEFWEIERELNEDASDLAHIASLDPCGELLWHFSELFRQHKFDKKRKEKQAQECEALRKVMLRRPGKQTRRGKLRAFATEVNDNVHA